MGRGHDAEHPVKMSEGERFLLWVLLWVGLGIAGGGLIGWLAFAIDENLYRGRRWWRLW
jgi:hypothetical protein